MNLSRRYTSLMEQLQAECQEKQQLQVDLAELEGTLKARILFLEQHKLDADAHLAKLQQQLDDSVPAVRIVLSREYRTTGMEDFIPSSCALGRRSMSAS